MGPIEFIGYSIMTIVIAIWAYFEGRWDRQKERLHRKER